MKNLLIITVLAGLLLGSFATLKVTSDRDESVDFNQYQSFEIIGLEKV